ncbi:MAG TPA: hypothetical protein VIK33_09010 [Anaerolineae bacterium]
MLDRQHFIRWLEHIYATGEGEIDCEQLQAVLAVYVDEEIAGRDLGSRAAPIRAHLAQCPDCAEEYEGLRAVAELEARGRLPQVEESLAQFEETPASEVEETIRVVESN